MFTAICRKVLHEEARGYMRIPVKQKAREISLSELSEKQMAGLCVLDKYPSNRIHFDVVVENETKKRNDCTR